MKYLITGVKGQLGYDIVRELEKRDEHEYLALDAEEMDITDRDKVREVIMEYQPDAIFHCAAYTAVDKAEDNVETCEKVNVEGTRNIAEAAREVGSKLIYLSTDYVFDGTKEGKYVPEDPTNPKSVYGKTKYLGELEALKVLKHYIVRISWVFGINGHNFIKTMLKLAETHDVVSVVSDQVGSPTYTVDLARLLVDMAHADRYGIYHATNEGECSWADFAEYIFKANGKDTKVNHITSEEYPQKAYRPRNSRLSKDKLVENGFDLLPTWQDAVDRYSEELNKVYVKGAK